MYAPEAHALAHALVEMAWLGFTVVFTLTPLYFMVGFANNAASYFFYMFIIWLDCLCFMGLGQWLVAMLPNAAMSQAATSLLLPIAAIFGGVYLPKNQLPNGAPNHPGVYWLWLYYIDPVSHSFEALAGSRFADMSRPSTVNHMIDVPRGLEVDHYDALHFLEATRGMVRRSVIFGALPLTPVGLQDYTHRFRQIGYMVAIAGGMQLAHLYAQHFKNHAVR